MSLKLSILSLLLLILTQGCKDNTNDTQTDIVQEIKALTDDDAKRDFLELIFEKDQLVRKGDGEIILEHGIDSEEFKTHTENMNTQDAENLAKIEYYLRVYRYPKKEFGEIANMTPWLVIHHAGAYEDRVRNFPVLYKAYTQGDLDKGQFSMYLSRMYSHAKGAHPEMVGSYKEEDKINMMIETLELQTTE